ncbi:amino acid adenylation domain-containing protein [Nocardiopsis coralliicola]
MNGTPRTLYGWFARSAGRYGDCSALELGDEKLTYRQLQHRAERIAAQLVAANGAVPPSRVGLLAERSVFAYAGYLAVLRTGAAVVPLNPKFPVARNAAVAAAAQVDLVATDIPGAAGSELGESLHVVGPEDLAAPGAGPPAELPPCPATPEDTAYILFTSGSTGAPKGVPVLHRNIGSYLSTLLSRYGIDPSCRMSQTFDLTFDVSVHDMFVAWGGGGTLVVPRRSQLLAPVKFINAARLTHWFSVPSLASFAQRLGTLAPGSMPTLRWSAFGGEPLPQTLARAWQAAAPSSSLENLYGPTEVTVSCAGYRLPRAVEDWPETANGTVPIGPVYPSLEFLLVDEHGVPGTSGELCIRGPQRFPGYLDPADNDGRFVRLGENGAVHTYTAPAPLTDEHWYRTGDRAAVHHGGLVHLGRLDDQVKVRGYRIELGEIEARLRQQSGVRDATVVAVGGPDGETELEAAVTTAPGADTGAMYTALSEHLPPYMVPRRITRLAELPLNANGKIDRRALAAALGTAH